MNKSSNTHTELQSLTWTIQGQFVPWGRANKRSTKASIQNYD